MIMTEYEQRYQAMQAMAPWDLDARAAAAARLAFEQKAVDVRVRQPSPTEWPSSPMASDVSIHDLLGASLITYDQHLDLADASAAVSPLGYTQEFPAALEPKAVFVQYQSPDPVTGGLSPVVVPASLSLDVFADPNWFGTPVEEEKVIEEEKDDNEEEDRQKLRSSIKGDPILSRAKPAPPPDPYFAPLRHETLLPKLCGSGAIGPLFTGTSSSKATAVEGTQMVTRRVEASGTMSSFLKACGKDKYSRSRIMEIDSILKSTSSRDQGATARDLFATSLAQADISTPQRPSTTQNDGRELITPGVGSPSRRPGALRTPRGGSGGGWRDTDSSALASQMAMYIQRMPQFHRGKMARHTDINVAGVDIDSSEAGDGASATALTNGTAGHNAEDGDGMEGGRRSPGSQSVAPEVGLPSPTSTAPAALGGTGRTSLPGEDMDAESRGHSPLKRGSQAEARGRASGSRALSKKLRDLDPHIDISENVPTQRLHSNWPDAQRRQLSRHFYGLSPAQILEEEEKERIRERRAARGKDPSAEVNGEAATDEAAVDETRTAKAQARREAERRRLDRSFARADGGDFHRLEVRIRNVARPDRVVVGRHTGKQAENESRSRTCMILDQLRANHWVKG